MGILEIVKNPAEVVRRAEKFFTRDIWRADADALGWPLAPLFRVLRVVQLAIRGIVVNRATFTASALTFTTVLSIVPLLAFAFSVAKGVGGYERLRNQFIDPFLVANLGPDTPDAPQAIQSLHDAIDKILELVSSTDVGSLGALGLTILVLAVIRVLSGIEDAFNRIWGVRRARRWGRRISDYISLAVATPLLMIASVVATTAAQNNAVVEAIRERPAMGEVLDKIFGLAPLAAIFLGFTLLFLILPNTRVRLSSAALGGLVGGALWQLAQIGHVKFQIGMANYNAIYASFAAIPIFLAWVYVSWVTVMFGAEFAHAHQGAAHHRQLKNLELDSRRQRDLLVLRACAVLAGRFLEKRGTVPREELAEMLDVPTAPLAEALQPIVVAGLVAETEVDDHSAWLFTRDPRETNLIDVLAPLWDLGDTDEDHDAVERAYARLIDTLRAADTNRDLASIAEDMKI